MSTRSAPRGPSVYLIAYDIGDAKRLRVVARIMEGAGDRVQFSVFRCVLSDKRLARLIAELEVAIAPRQDQILIVPLGEADRPRAWRMQTLGLPIRPVEDSVTVL